MLPSFCPRLLISVPSRAFLSCTLVPRLSLALSRAFASAFAIGSPLSNPFPLTRSAVVRAITPRVTKRRVFHSASSAHDQLATTKVPRDLKSEHRKECLRRRSEFNLRFLGSIPRYERFHIRVV